MLPFTANAQSDVPLPLDEQMIVINEAVVDYPTEVHFRLEVDPSMTLSDATLTYDVEQVSCLEVSTQVPVEVNGTLAEWDWAMIRSGNHTHSLPSHF